MPVYEFVCTECGERFELTETVAEHEKHLKERCPKCKSTKVEQRWSRVFAVTSKKS